MFKNILLATDGSAASHHAAELAIKLARSVNATLTAVYVVDPYPYLGMGDLNPMGLQAYLSSARDHAAQAHAKIAQLCEGPGPAINLQVRLIEDATAFEGIVSTAKAESCDLIVAGSHGRTGIDSLLLGSIAAKLVARAPVPVLVAR